MKAAKRILVVLDQTVFMESRIPLGITEYQQAHPHIHIRMDTLQGGEMEPDKVIRRMIGVYRPDGLLATLPGTELLNAIPKRLPLVNIGTYLGPRIHAVHIDQSHIGALAAEHLLDQTLPHFAYAEIAHPDALLHQRSTGFHTRLAQAGHPHIPADYVRSNGGGEDDTSATLRRWLTDLPKPVGIHVTTATLGLRVLAACEELGLHIPNDVAVIAGFDYPTLTTSWNPPLTAIEFDYPKVGYEGLRLMDRILQGCRPPAQPVLLTMGKVVPRRSSDFKSTRDPEIARLNDLVAAEPQLSVKELLERTTLQRRTLERRFLKYTGYRLHEGLMRSRVARACRLLRETHLPVIEIAAQCGYASPAVFGTAFRKQTGLAPTDFRRAGCGGKGER